MSTKSSFWSSFLLLLMLLVSVCGCVGTGTPTPLLQTASLTPSAIPATPIAMPTSEPGLERARQVDAIFGEFISKNTPGGVVLVIHEGRILYEAAYGLADIKNKTPLTTQSILHLGSIGKHFTAVAVVLLAEQGKLNLDDPIEKYFPELSRFGQDVTIRRLLQHTSGIPDYYDNRPLAKVNQRT